MVRKLDCLKACVLVCFVERAFKAQNRPSKSPSIGSNSSGNHASLTATVFGLNTLGVTLFFSFDVLERHLSTRWRSGRGLRI
jgi:hypothetical protein